MIYHYYKESDEKIARKCEREGKDLPQSNKFK
jgi:hypothetical protein